MKAAIDTNILLDILIPDETFYPGSKRLLDDYLEKGELIICESVYAELASQFAAEQELNEFLADTGIRLVSSNARTLYLGGERWKEYAKNRKRAIYCPNCGKETDIFCRHCKSSLTFRHRVLSDFVIGAHALLHANVLLSRDRGFYRTYFEDLEVVS